jgi:hypothetical protein
MMKPMPPPRLQLTPQELAIRRKRSIVLAFVLAGLALLFFVTTIVRLGGNVADRAF